TDATAASGTQQKTVRASGGRSPSAADATGAPTASASRRACPAERLKTAHTACPRPASRRASADPTAPAPMMAMAPGDKELRTLDLGFWLGKAGEGERSGSPPFSLPNPRSKIRNPKAKSPPAEDGAEVAGQVVAGGFQVEHVDAVRAAVAGGDEGHEQRAFAFDAHLLAVEQGRQPPQVGLL